MKIKICMGMHDFLTRSLFEALQIRNETIARVEAILPDAAAQEFLQWVDHLARTTILSWSEAAELGQRVLMRCASRIAQAGPVKKPPAWALVHANNLLGSLSECPTCGGRLDQRFIAAICEDAWHAVHHGMNRSVGPS